MDIAPLMDAPIAVVLLACSVAMIVYERRGLARDVLFFKSRSARFYWMFYLSLAVLGTAFLISALV